MEKKIKIEKEAKRINICMRKLRTCIGIFTKESRKETRKYYKERQEIDRKEWMDTIDK